MVEEVCVAAAGGQRKAAGGWLTWTFTSPSITTVAEGEWVLMFWTGGRAGLGGG